MWALVARDIRIVVARSFSEFYRANCVQNAGPPIALDDGNDALAALGMETVDMTAFIVDLREQVIVAPGARRFPFPARRLTARCCSTASTPTDSA